jgi:hypothetical protein
VTADIEGDDDTAAPPTWSAPTARSPKLDVLSEADMLVAHGVGLYAVSGHVLDDDDDDGAIDGVSGISGGITGGVCGGGDDDDDDDDESPAMEEHKDRGDAEGRRWGVDAGGVDRGVDISLDTLESVSVWGNAKIDDDHESASDSRAGFTSTAGDREPRRKGDGGEDLSRQGHKDVSEDEGCLRDGIDQSGGDGGAVDGRCGGDDARDGSSEAVWLGGDDASSAARTAAGMGGETTPPRHAVVKRQAGRESSADLDSLVPDKGVGEPSPSPSPPPPPPSNHVSTSWADDGGPRSGGGRGLVGSGSSGGSGSAGGAAGRGADNWNLRHTFLHAFRKASLSPNRKV